MAKSQTPLATLAPMLAMDGLLTSRTADVGRTRERRRRERLRSLAVVTGIPAAYLWYRYADGRPFNVFAFPHIDWLIAAPLIFFGLLIVLMVGSQFFTGRSPHTVYRPEQLDVRLDDVVGIDQVKDEVVRSLNLFLAHSTFARDMGGRARRGILFEGGPGTGKTHTAKAMAAEAGVPFLYASATGFQSTWQNAGQRKVRSYFRALRKAAVNEGGAIGFIDEFDAIARSRRGMESAASTPTRIAGCGGLVGLPTLATNAALETTRFVGGSDGSDSVVNELLVQLQSFEELVGWSKHRGRLVDWVNSYLPEDRAFRKPAPKTANILLIAATNRRDNLDPALLRPGRFDRQLHFDLPDRAGRRALIDHFLARKAHNAELELGDQRDAIAAVTQGYTPAEIEGLLDEALINAVRRGAPSMSRSDVEKARLTTEVGLGQPKAYTDHERRLIATHEAGHTVTAYLAAPHRRLEVLSIIKRRDALGMLAHGDAEDVYTRSRAELRALIQIAMGGQCAEEIWFGDVTTGPSGDLLYATNIAAQMVGSAGMSGTLVSYDAVQNSAFNDSNIVGRVLADPDGRERVGTLLVEQKTETRRLLESHRHLVEALRDALLDREELIGREITDVIEAARRAHGDTVIDLRSHDGLVAD